MAQLDLLSIPGYGAAVAKETQARDLAYFTEPVPILGIPIRHLNLRHHMLLGGSGNHFVVGGRITHIDVAGLLWILSPEYSLTAGAREQFLRSKVAPLPFQELALACAAYVADVYLDMARGSGQTNPTERSYTTDTTYLIDLLALEYGWTDEHILQMPLARVFQLLRQMKMRKNPKAIMFNPSDALIGRHLAASLTGGQS